MRRFGVVFLGLALAAGVVAASVGAAGATRAGAGSVKAPAAAAALPSKMAALGDSITQGFDALGQAGGIKSEPQYSWATGTASAKVVNSQYIRLVAVDAKLKNKEFNDSVVGAQMSGLAAQVTNAIKQKASYVVILMGANDACAPSISAMTSVSSFTKTFATDLSKLMKGLPKGAHVTVYSIPNLYRLWSLFHNNSSAEFAWSFLRCQSMLSPKNTAADRTKVLNREKAFNSALAAGCKKYSNCRWDGDAVFNFKFTAADVNNLDYFHPSVAGQKQLAAITWSKSWWPKSK